MMHIPYVYNISERKIEIVYTYIHVHMMYTHIYTNTHIYKHRQIYKYTKHRHTDGHTDTHTLSINGIMFLFKCINESKSC